MNVLNIQGLTDLSFICQLVGNGSNEVRKFYLFDKENNKELVAITNSPDYPNLSYDDNSNCFVSQRYYGTIMIEFLHLEGDSLVRFDSLEFDDN